MTRPGCDYAVHVHLEDRHFIVEYSADGDVLRIKERKYKEPSFLRVGGLYTVSYWKAGTHPLGTSNTIPKRIIAAALAKITAEDRSIDACP